MVFKFYPYIIYFTHNLSLFNLILFKSKNENQTQIIFHVMRYFNFSNVKKISHVPLAIVRSKMCVCIIVCLFKLSSLSFSFQF